MSNLVTPLARFHLSKHYTTKTTIIYRSLLYPQERDLTNLFKPNTEITAFNIAYLYTDGNPQY